MWGCSSVGRALASHVRGQGFESPHLHQVVSSINSVFIELFFLSNGGRAGEGTDEYAQTGLVPPCAHAKGTGRTGRDTLCMG